MVDGGFPIVPESTIRSTLDSMYLVTQQNWFLQDDAIPTLGELCRQDQRLGMISNSSDDRNVRQLINRYNLCT